MFKLTLLILVLTFSHAGAEVFAQKASISAKNMELKALFKELRKQTGYHFLYVETDLKGIQPINLSLVNMPLEKILDHCFEGQPLTYKIRKNRVLVERRELRVGHHVPDHDIEEIQQREITGQVLDEGGQPLEGVTVLVKGTTTATTTDAAGNYRLTIRPGAIDLVFTIVGFESQEVLIGEGSVISVTMREAVSDLEEVVVVGYGTQRKETLTGAVTSIRAEEIVTTKTENLINNIQGKMPGVLIRQQTAEPGTFNNMVSIRGYGAPLVVIDGIPRDGTSELAQLNPNDVESISVLKDAAAAIYGFNSANGVIIVTTKKGQSGRANFSYSTLLGTKGATGLERTVDAYTYRLMRNEMDRNIGNAHFYSDEILERYRVGEPGYEDHDWVDLTLHNRVFQQQHDLSVRGGSDQVRYFASFNYTEDNGLLKSDIQKFRRYNFRSTTTANLTKDLQLNLLMAGRFDNTQRPRNDFLWVFKPIMVNDRGFNYHTIANPNHMSALPPENTNPVAMMDPDIDGYRRSSNMQYQSTLDLTYTVPFIPGLKATALAAYDRNIATNSTLQRQYGLYDYYTDAFQAPTGTDQISNGVNLHTRTHVRAQLDYRTTFGKSHNLGVMGLTEFAHTRFDNLSGGRQYTDLYTHDIINQGDPSTATNSGNRDFSALASYLGRINYDFAGKYLLEVVGRYDGSYRYAPGKRWAFFPSVSAGWRISEEAFVQNNLPFLSDLKLRGSYGESGLDTGNPFSFIPGYTQFGAGYVFNPNELTVGMMPPGVVNDHMTWITASTANIGLDFGFAQGKFTGAIDVFERKRSGLLAARVQSIPNTFGASLPQENIDSDLDHGIEFSFAYNGRIGEEFSFTVAANTTYSRRKQLHVERASFTSSMDRWRNGNEYRYTGRLWQYEYDGRYTSAEQYETAPLMGGALGNSRMLPGSWALIDRNGDGIINANDQSPNHWAFGAVNPPLQYGMTLGGSYKSFDFNILFQGAALYSINYHMNDIWGYGRYPSLHQRFMDRWHTVNPTDDPYDPSTQWTPGYFPALRTNTDNTSDGNRIDVWTPPATYLRLKNLELGYSLPQNLLQRVRLQGLRIFANGFNILTFSRRELRQADPERQESDWDANLTYPLMKSYNVGININF